MNRELKFRAWDLTNKCWINPESIVIRIDNLAIFDRETGDELHNVELVQFMGFPDKNGEDIYEGYILRCGKNGKTFVIKFKDGHFYFESIDKTMTIHFLHIILNLKPEKIGNIYENPELLENNNAD